MSNTAHRTTDAPFAFRTASPDGSARLGWFTTPHGVVETPAFMPVGTHAAIRGLTMSDVAAVGARMVLSNAYHLYLRPGDAMVRALGGLHAFARWSGPMLTDSGGYQVFSLARYRTVREEGVEFRSKLDGSRHAYTPERVMQIERNLGADVIMQLDELIAGGSDESASRSAMERSLRWLERCRVEFGRLGCEGRAPLAEIPVPHGTPPVASARDAMECQSPVQSLFPIVQGGVNAGLRRASIQGILSCGAWDGIAIGGLSVGESKSDLLATLEVCDPELPRDRPRYLMGVGFPDDLIEAVRRGMDLFDCVAPTRIGRHGTAFTRDGTVQVTKSSYRTDRRPLDDSCACAACTDYDRAYLRHLFAADEPLGPRLLALHNLAFLLRLMRDAREALGAGTFAGWSAEWLGRYRARSTGM
ncbi:MAG: tRNA guanosine(34) transglycosylase Tgt [Gemmatimonadaceae bacterium]|nr:tRNA guanosine(34) transglycosylase Tgt [Gemmatimonadaceae bacterium]